MTTPQPEPATIPALQSHSDSVGESSFVAVCARGVEKTPAAITAGVKEAGIGEDR
jgi:hypothetical protein